MIQNYRAIEELRRLLEEEIPREMWHYRNQVESGTATEHWHTQATQQCDAWNARITALQSQFGALQGRYPQWTSAAIQELLADLAAIKAAIGGDHSTLAAVLQARLAPSI